MCGSPTHNPPACGARAGAAHATAHHAPHSAQSGRACRHTAVQCSDRRPSVRRDAVRSEERYAPLPCAHLHRARVGKLILQQRIPPLVALRDRARRKVHRDPAAKRSACTNQEGAASGSTVRVQLAGITAVDALAHAPPPLLQAVRLDRLEQRPVLVLAPRQRARALRPKAPRGLSGAVRAGARTSVAGGRGRGARLRRSR
eukprot:257921-Prymnesium_polylepis.1